MNEDMDIFVAVFMTLIVGLIITAVIVTLAVGLPELIRHAIHSWSCVFNPWLPECRA